MLQTSPNYRAALRRACGASYVVSFTVPYNGGLNPAGTRRKFGA
jgi:hypothetical protein